MALAPQGEGLHGFKGPSVGIGSEKFKFIYNKMNQLHDAAK